jgi:hypothetical protein
MDFPTSCLSLALATIKSIDLKTPCEPEALCARLDEMEFPNILVPVPMTGRVTGYCEKDAFGRYILMYDATGTREQQVRDICHEVGHVIAGHTLVGLFCTRANSLSDPREREAETIADWLVVLLSLPDASRYDVTDFRLLMEQINRGHRSAGRRWPWPFGGKRRCSELLHRVRLRP